MSAVTEPTDYEEKKPLKTLKAQKMFSQILGFGTQHSIKIRKYISTPSLTFGLGVQG